MFLHGIDRRAIRAEDQIDRLRILIAGGALLSSARGTPRPSSPVEPDLATALDMRVSQDPLGWDDPRPWEYFPDAMEEATTRYLFDTGAGIPDLSAAKAAFAMQEDALGADCLDVTRRAVDALLSAPGATGDARARDILTNEVASDLLLIVKSAFFEPIGNSPLLNAILGAYEAGGFPCGWRGPLPSDGGDIGSGLILWFPGSP